MYDAYNKFFRQRELIDYGSFLFFLGIFFLPSSLFIGIIFLLPAAIIGSCFQKKSFLKDQWNYPFLIFGLLILTNSILQNFVLSNNYKEIWDPMLSILGMGNWLPYIWFFWAFQPYLNSKSNRRLLGVILIISSVPVLITGFGQYFFNWTGPLKTLNGLIIWYQKPIISPGGLSGLFSNQNYTGSWLNFTWPFCIALLIEKRDNLLKKTTAFCFLVSVGFAAFLTYSRNAWLGLFVSIPIVLGKKGIYIILAIITIIILILFIVFAPIFNADIQSQIRELLPQKILLEFTDKGYQNLDAKRIEIFLSAINLIKINPIFGIGAASFPAIYFLETTFWKGHSHNLLLELAISYGLPATIIFFITISSIIIISGKLILRNNFNEVSLFDKAIWAALFFFLISQLVDIQYFDGKISIITWILIASLKNIIQEVKYRNLEVS